MLDWIKEKLRQQPKEKIYPKATQEDIGRWVQVRDDGLEEWVGPYILNNVNPSGLLPYKAVRSNWGHARVVPGPRIRGALHDCNSETMPANVGFDDFVLVEFRQGPIYVEFHGSGWPPFPAPYVVMSAGDTPWSEVTRYQILDIK